MVMMAAQCECTLYHRTVHLKMAMMAHFMLRIFQHNKKKSFKTIVCLYTSNEQGKFEIKLTISFTLAFLQMK